MYNSNPNQVPVEGDCYQASFKNSMDLLVMKKSVEMKEPDADEFAELYHRFGLNNDVVIVHGWATSPKGPDAGKRIHHAWIEVGNFVIETQGGTRRRIPKGEYYDLFKIYPNQKYTVHEAADYIDRDQKFHAWRGKGPDQEPTTTPAASAEPPPATS